MNDKKTNQKLSPRRAIVIYHDQRKDNFYLESREIKPVGGSLRLMQAVPLSDNIMKDVAKSYMKTSAAEMNHEQLVGPHILHGSNRIGKTAVMWYRPAMERSLNFSASLNIKGDCRVHVPATLYLVINQKLYLYALMTNDRPEMGTKIYCAPFFNIYEDGNVCLGTAPIGRVKAKTFEREAERFERAFYMAEQNGGQSANACKTPLSKLWTLLIKKKAAFPSKAQLIQHKKYKTVSSLLSHLVGEVKPTYNDDTYYDEEDDN